MKQIFSLIASAIFSIHAYSQNTNPAIGTSTVQFNLDMQKNINDNSFKPGKDFVDAAGSFDQWGAPGIRLTQVGTSSLYTFSIDTLTEGETIQFKFRINGNWTTSEFPNAAPNRSFLVKDKEVYNALFNDTSVTIGLVTGIKPVFNMDNTMKIYPNPSTGHFTIDVNAIQTDEYTITVSNIQGELIRKEVIKANTGQFSETIDLSTKGFYLVRFNTEKEEFLKRIVIN